jgi:predicted acetyltransferase
LAALYASQAAIYQRFGYGIVSTHNRYAVEPRYLRFANPVEVPGKLREINPQDEFPLLVEVFRKFREDRIGYIHRGRSSWDYGPIEKAPAGSFQRAAVYEVGGEAQGYVVYRVGPSGFEGPGPAQAVNITDLAWLNHAAYAALWRPFEGMALAREVRWGSVPTDDPLPHLLLEPRMLRTTSRDGLLARIIDVPSVLAARPYEEEQLLRFEVSDAMAPWNAGRWSFETAKEGATVKPEGGSQVDLSMDIGTLAMLVFGQITATQAARMGRVEVHDQRALARWDTALRTKYRPFCPDQF